MPRFLNYAPAVTVVALIAWAAIIEARRILRRRTDVSRMTGPVTAEQTGLSEWEQEQWDLFMAGHPDLMLKGRLR